MFICLRSTIGSENDHEKINVAILSSTTVLPITSIKQFNVKLSSVGTIKAVCRCDLRRKITECTLFTDLY